MSALTRLGLALMTRILGVLALVALVQGMQPASEPWAPPGLHAQAAIVMVAPAKLVLAKSAPSDPRGRDLVAVMPDPTTLGRFQPAGRRLAWAMAETSFEPLLTSGFQARAPPQLAAIPAI